MTIIDPRAGPELQGAPAAPERPLRPVEGGLLLAIVVLLVTALLGAWHVHGHGSGGSRGAGDDKVSLTISRVGATTLAAGSGRVTITAVVSTREPKLVLSSVYVEAAGYAASDAQRTTPDLTGSTTQVAGLLILNCAAVRRGELPEDVRLVLLAVPASGHTHEIAQPVSAAVLKPPMESACQVAGHVTGPAGSTGPNGGPSSGPSRSPTNPPTGGSGSTHVGS